MHGERGEGACGGVSPSDLKKQRKQKREERKGDILWAFTWERERAGAHGVRWPEGGVGDARENSWWYRKKKSTRKKPKKRDSLSLLMPGRRGHMEGSGGVA